MAMSYRIRGRVFGGMFPDERVVEVRDHKGRVFSFLISFDRLRGVKDDEASVDVRVVDRSDDLALVRLPGEPLAESTISVNASELEPVGGSR